MFPNQLNGQLSTDKIMTIKNIRDKTGCGLKDAKDAVEEAEKADAIGTEAHFAKALELAKQKLTQQPQPKFGQAQAGKTIDPLTRSRIEEEIAKRTAAVRRQTGCSTEVAQKHLLEAEGNVREAVSRVRCDAMDGQTRMIILGRLYDTCPCCQRARSLRQFFLMRQGAVWDGLACWNCLGRILANMNLLADMRFHGSC